MTVETWLLSEEERQQGSAEPVSSLPRYLRTWIFISWQVRSSETGGLGLMALVGTLHLFILRGLPEADHLHLFGRNLGLT
jgi:hypothetical protein